MDLPPPSAPYMSTAALEASFKWQTEFNQWQEKQNWDTQRNDCVNMEPIRNPVTLPCGHVLEEASANAIKNSYARACCPTCVAPFQTCVKSLALKNAFETTDLYFRRFYQKVEELSMENAMLRSQQLAGHVSSARLEMPIASFTPIPLGDYPASPDDLSRWICNRQWTPADDHEKQKYPGLERWASFKNDNGNGLFSYLRINAYRDGIRIFISSDQPEKFAAYLHSVGLKPMPYEAVPEGQTPRAGTHNRTCIDTSTGPKRGEQVPMGVFETDDPRELDWILRTFQANNDRAQGRSEAWNAILKKYEEEYILLEKLIKSPKNWQRVEMENSDLIRRGMTTYFNTARAEERGKKLQALRQASPEMFRHIQKAQRVRFSYLSKIRGRFSYLSKIPGFSRIQKVVAYAFKPVSYLFVRFRKLLSKA